MQRSYRPLLSVPGLLIGGFVLALCLQILSHQLVRQEYRVDYKALTKPLSDSTYRGLSMGSEQLVSYLLSLKLQLHDNQAGRHIRYNFIDYDLLIEWLKTIQQINPVSEYPMLLASRIFSQTPDKSQMRKMLKYINDSFLTNPELFWRNQAEATVIAKHRLGDLQLALDMAEKLFRLPVTVEIPQWARDMHFLLLADLNEFETTIIIIKSMLESETVTDPDQIRFLKQKLSEFQQKLSEYERKELQETKAAD